MTEPTTPRKLARAARRAARRTIERLGWVAARTSDYYSPLRPLSELERNVARWHRPSAMAGVAFDLEAMKVMLAELVATLGEEYARLPPYDEAKRARRGPGFTRVDAMVLYLMLRRGRPRRYLEVGSGLSTYYAALALERNAGEGKPARMTVVDPFPSAATRALLGVEVVAREAQDVPVEWYAELEGGDVLFIDSTHIVRIDGEAPYLVLEVLPRLRSGVLVQIHDVHFPYHVPCHAGAYVFDRRSPLLFTEPMLVQAYLAHNPRVEILLSTPLLRHYDEDFLRRTIPDYQPLDPEDFDTHHGSLWLRVR